MKTKEFLYQGKIVEFFFLNDVLVNATEMAAVFGKKTAAFLRLESTKRYVEALEKTAIRANRSADSALRFAEKGDLPGEIKARSADLVPLIVVEKGGSEGGTTWLYEDLAIDFAMWLDVDFRIWVNSKIREIIHFYANGKRSIAMKRMELDDREREIFKTKSQTNPDIKELAEIRDMRNQLKGDELNLNKEFKKNIFE